MIGSKKLGELANRVANDVRRRRRLDLGIDKEPESLKMLPTYVSPSQARQRELDGGIIIIGRPTWKEFLHGLHRGWTEGLKNVDQDEILARELEDDGAFDEPDEPELVGDEPSDTRPRPFTQHKPSLYSPIQVSNILQPRHKSNTESSSSSELTNIPPPTEIPLLPPILLVPFTDYIGISQIPLMIWDFFNQRHKVQSGAEAAYNVITKHTRPLHPPSDDSELIETDVSPDSGHSDLDFDKQSEAYLKDSLNKIPNEIEKARKTYYEELPKKLETARALARGIREPTNDELSNPPPTEVELRQERLNKERRWRNDLVGWTIVKPSTPAVWDSRFRHAIQLFTGLPPSADGTFNS